MTVPEADYGFDLNYSHVRPFAGVTPVVTDLYHPISSLSKKEIAIA
jgi:hypothetical protein